MSPIEAFKRAVAEAGGQTKFGVIVGASQQRVWSLLNAAKKKPMPAEWVLPAEGATGISRHILRPDLYPSGEFDDGRERAATE